MIRPANISAGANLPVLAVSTVRCHHGHLLNAKPTLSSGSTVEDLRKGPTQCEYWQSNGLAHGVTLALLDREKYNGSAIVQRSIDIGELIIYVAMNYR